MVEVFSSYRPPVGLKAGRKVGVNVKDILQDKLGCLQMYSREQGYDLDYYYSVEADTFNFLFSNRMSGLEIAVKLAYVKVRNLTPHAIFITLLGRFQEHYLINKEDN